MSAGPNQPPFPFIVGMGRSGTTLLRAMLDSHPRLAVTPETYFVPRLGRSRAKYERSNGLAVDALVRDLLDTNGYPNLRLAEEETRAALTASGAGTYPDAIRAIYARYAEREGKERYADKTPAYGERMETLAELFPESVFVHIIRDGRDVALSYLDAPFGPSRVAQAALGWRGRILAARQAADALAEERYLELRYEELVDDPERVLRALCDAIELDYDEAMLEYPDRAADVLTRGSDQHRAVFEAPTKGLRDWREEMAASDLRTFELVAGDLLAELGYQRATEHREDPSVAALVAELHGLAAELSASRRDAARRLVAERSRRWRLAERLREARRSSDATPPDG